MNESTQKPSENTVNVHFISGVPDEVESYLKAKLKHLSNVVLNFHEKHTKEEETTSISQADIVIGWRPSKRILKKALNMKLFINPGAGVNQLIDIFREVNQTRDVKLINGHGNSYFVAQHAVALLLTLMSKTIPHHLWMKEGTWRTGDKESASIPLRFRKIGLLGYGAINQKVHSMLSGFAIEFSILRRSWNKQQGELITPASRYTYEEFHEFLKEIDTLFVAIPVTKLTSGMIGAEELKLLGKKGLLVNVSRGEIIDEESLYRALKEEIIKGAAIDVWYDYTPKEDDFGRKYPFHFPFHELDNIVLSPHRGYSPFSDLLRWNEVIENIERMALGRDDFINVVNLEHEY